MPVLCAVSDCRITDGMGVMMHRWPKNERIAQMWTRFVRVKRKPGPGQKNEWQPTKSSKVCTRHFE